MSQLLTYLPYQIAAELLGGAPLIGRTQRDMAVALFADVLGFTPMSEALSQYGQDGTEELTALINDYFAVMIDLISSYGGLVGAFGGDALTVIFPLDGPVAAARALRCALDMQALMAGYREIATHAGQFSLAIKIGLALGPVLTSVAGDPEFRLQAVLAGRAIEHAAEAEHQARSGEVLAHRSLRDYAPDLAAGRDRGAFLVVDGLNVTAPYAPLAALPAAPPELLPTLRAFVHPSIARRLDDGRAGFVNEHREVSVLFVGFDGFDYDDDPQVGARLQEYVAAATWIIQQYDGDLNKVDIGDKGSKFVVVFGAPLAHENDIERAMRCALALRELTIAHGASAPQHAVRIGIASGLVYCGLVGGAQRREYTVMGDTVNLAARLMQAAAPGEIIVSGASQQRVAEQFRWTPLSALAMKGRSQPATVYRLEDERQRASRHQEPAYKLPMVGREQEIQAIDLRIAQARRGQGALVGVSAEAGMGKSRLLAEVIRLAGRSGMRVLNGECLSYGGNISYRPWHSLLRGLFGLDPAWPQEAQRRRLREQLVALNPQLLHRLPVLAAAIGLPAEETELTRSLDARVRKDVLETSVLECLRASAGAGLLLVIEDCHWIDPLSHDLLEVVARGIVDRPVLILLAYRPPEHESARLRVARLPHFSELQLREFSLRETEWLIGLKFGYLFGAPGVLPASFIQRITTRSQGNPFYIDQMINYIQDQGISPADTQALERVRLPDTLRALIISRIDRLSEQEQITLKVASVVGRVFRASWLWGVYPQLGPPDQVRAHLDQLSRLELTPMEKAEPELEYLFKHMVTQEVAYESLAYATRAMLHEQVGDYIEVAFADEAERYLDMLAYHYGRSENHAKQRHYFRLAGDAAQAAYANAAAIEYFRRLLPLLDEPAQVPVMLQLGEVLQLVGRWAEAAEAFRQARAQAEAAGDAARAARCQNAMANLLAARGAYEEAMAILTAVRPIWEQLGDLGGLYDALRILGAILVDIGAYTRGLRAIEHAHEIAVRLNDRRLIGRSIGQMGLVYIDIGDYEMALYCLERSAQMAAQADDWAMLARSREGIGFIYLSQGQLAEALVLFHGLLRRAMEIGDRRAVARLNNEIGRAHTLYGELELGMACYARQLAIALDMGERRDLCVGLGYVAHAYAAAGRLDAAERVGELAIALCDSIMLVYWGCEFRHDLAMLYLDQGRYAEAIVLNNAALKTARNLGSHRELQLRATLLAARLRALMGEDRALALAAVESLDEDWYSDRERAALRYTLWQIDRSRAADRAAAAQLYAELAAATPTAEYRARCGELGGLLPPAPAPLAALPAGADEPPPPLDLLLAHAEDLVATAT